MTEELSRLAEIADELKQGKQPEPETVRTLLGWFDAQRRGYHVNSLIERALGRYGIKTLPDFRYAYIDSKINFVPATQESETASSETKIPPPETGDGSEIPLEAPEVTVEPTVTIVTTVGGAIEDPTYRIGRLAAANNPPVSVKPNGTLREAVTLMLTHDFSQLPVMQSEREVKGVISWESIGTRLATGNKDDTVSNYTDPHYELSADVSLFAAIGVIVERDYVLIRGAQNKITGIVTTSDLSLQFHQLGEPFLLLGEIENHVRRMIDCKFTQEELSANRDPSDSAREVSSVSDLTFGEYLWLLQNPDNWERLGLFIDRKVFVEQLNKVRVIRNDVMHFDPDGLSPDDLDMLRSFVLFLQRLRELIDKKH
jgi:predicted transcriptional regulator